MANHGIQWDFTNGSLVLTTDTDTFTIDNTANVMSRVPVAFQCERNGAMQANHQFAWGNGSTGDGGAMPFSGKLVAASLSVTGSASGETITCQILKNGVAQGSGYQLAITGDGGTVLDVNEFATPLSFAAGDTINFINLNATVTAPTTTTGMFLVVYD